MMGWTRLEQLCWRYGHWSLFPERLFWLTVSDVWTEEQLCVVICKRVSKTMQVDGQHSKTMFELHA